MVKVDQFCFLSTFLLLVLQQVPICCSCQSSWKVALPFPLVHTTLFHCDLTVVSLTSFSFFGAAISCLQNPTLFVGRGGGSLLYPRPLVLTVLSQLIYYSLSADIDGIASIFCKDCRWSISCRLNYDLRLASR